MGTELRHLKYRLSHLFRSICLLGKLLCGIADKWLPALRANNDAVR
jgi:hypothetical protein